MALNYVHPHQAKARLFIDAPLEAETALSPEPGQMHYLINVMRCRAGERVLVFNGRDGEWLASVQLAGKKKCTLILHEQLRTQEAEPDVWLLFAPVKRLRLDFLVQKAAELGVSHLQPVKTEYTQVARVSGERLQANAVEAAEQSDRLSVPTVGSFISLAKILETWPKDRKIVFCDEMAGQNGASSARAMFEHAEKGPWAVLIGPEGGFSEEERKALRAHDFVYSVGLGPRILRSDTAAIAVLTLWQAFLGDWSVK